MTKAAGIAEGLLLFAGDKRSAYPHLIGVYDALSP
ncbi:hypothetical protein EL75_3825 [Escherichia coli]|nr:hypothetical protein EL75_3825 [Escherichia coli]KGM72405.1 hypothetical protein EL78_3601 [Escherichia coli]KGM77386.1 hypothetical protein EL80_3922 [Escherichia coli]KGM80032.1 hypothetical protein EL79_3978 [Escherichia coli]